MLRTPPSKKYVRLGGRIGSISRKFAEFQQIVAGFDVLYEISANSVKLSSTFIKLGAKKNEFEISLKKFAKFMY